MSECTCCHSRELVELPRSSKGYRKRGGPVFACPYCDGDVVEVARSN